MKKVQKTLTAALAATLATGVVGSVASAAPVNEIYAAAYNATINAQSKKDQVSINEARAAIAKIPTEFKSQIGKLSSMLDEVQQPIYVNILTALEKAQKENNQTNINAARKLLVGVEAAYANTWSAELDKSQQALIKKAQDACEKASKSQDAKELAEAKALLADIKTIELNDGVKDFMTKYEAEFTAKLNIFVEKVEVKNATTLEVTLSKDVDTATVKNESFTVKTGNVKAYAKEVKADKNVVTVTLNSKLDETKEYSLTVKGIKDAKGVAIKESAFNFKYEKKEVTGIEFKATTVARNSNLKDFIVVKDAAGRDVTKESKVTFECTEDKTVVSKDGKISAAAKVGKEFTIKVTCGDVVTEQKVTVATNLANQLVGFTLGSDKVDEDTKYSAVTPNAKIKVGDTVNLTVFYNDVLGKETTLDGAKITKIESLSKDIVSVNGDKKLTARKAGTALVRVQYGSIDETIEVVVTNDNVTDATLSMENSTVTIAKGKNVDKLLTYKVVDNSIDKTMDDCVGTVKTWNEKTEKWEDNKLGITAKNGVITINGLKVKENVRAKLVVNYGRVNLESEFDIESVDGGDISSYELVAVRNGKQVASLDQKKEQEATLKVYALDADGNRVSDLSNVNNVKKTTISIDGKDDVDFTATNAVVKAVGTQVGDHTYSIKVATKGSDEYTTNTLTLTIKNTDDTKTSFSADNVNDKQSLNTNFTWAYGGDVTNTNSTLVGIDADVNDVTDLTTTKGAIEADLIATTTPGAIKLELAAGKDSGSVNLFIRSISVKLTDGTVKVIQIDDSKTINVTK